MTGHRVHFHIYLDLIALVIIGILHGNVAVSYSFSDRIAVTSACRNTYNPAPVYNRFAATEHYRPIRINGKGAEFPFGPLFFDFGQGFPPQKITFVQSNAKVQACIKRSVFGC